MTRPRARRFRHGLAALAVAGLCQLSHGWAAEPSGLALVIGADRDAGVAGEGVCAAAARGVRDRLSGQGLAVQAVLNPSTVAARSAIDGFAERIEAGPPGMALIYVCGTAIPAVGRLFLMLPDAGPAGGADPARQGIVVQALLNALAGTGGTLYADLGLADPAAAGEVVEEARKRLPAGLHLALSLTERDGAARIGARLASPGFRAGQGWDATTAMLQAGTAPAEAVRTLPPADGSSASASPAQGAGAGAPSGPANAAPHSGRNAPIRPDPPRSQPETSPEPPARGGTEASKGAGEAAGQKGEPLDAAGIKRLQAALAPEGYGGPIDGRLNWAALVAIRVFQRSLGDPETGVLTPTELAHLLNR